MNKSDWPGRLFALDISRGFASFSVVLWHWQHFAFRGTVLPQGYSMKSQPLYCLLKLFYEKGHFAVDYFFILSGFIFFWLYRDSIRNRSTDVRQFAVKRLSRLYPLHVLSLMIVGVLQLIYTFRENSPFVYLFNDMYHFILNLGFISSWGFESGLSFNGPTWSVSVEVLLYVVFFFIAISRFGGMASTLIISLGSLAALYIFNNVVFSGLSLFFLGGLVYHLTVYILMFKRKLSWLVYGITILAWLGLIFHYYVYNLSEAMLTFGFLGKVFLKLYPNYFLFPLTVICLVLFEIEKGQWLKPFSWIGDITYSTYLLHFPLQLIFVLAASYGILDLALSSQPVFLLIFFAVLIFVSYFVYQKFERPMQYIIRDRFLKQQ